MTDRGQPYLAIEYVEGKRISTYCDQRKLGLKPRLQLFLQVLSAVQYAHAHLIVHRDLKPANILVTNDGDVRMLDFGIAKLLTEGEAGETELTRIGGRAFTPEYASPEQIAGNAVTTASDVYSLGIVLYELLTGCDIEMKNPPAVVCQNEEDVQDLESNRRHGEELHRLYWSERWPIRKIERHLRMSWRTIRKSIEPFIPTSPIDCIFPITP